MSVFDTTPAKDLSAATNGEWLRGYLRARDKLQMQIKAFSQCGLTEAESRARAQLRHVEEKICEYNAKVRAEQREMYKQVLRIMMACDYAYGLSLDFAAYVEKHSSSTGGYDLVGDVKNFKDACEGVLHGMEECFKYKSLSAYAKVQSDLEDKIKPIYDDATEVLAKELDRV